MTKSIEWVNLISLHLAKTFLFLLYSVAVAVVYR